MNKTDKIKKKLQIVMYVLIILSILRSFIARASANDYYSSKDYIEDYFKEIDFSGIEYIFDDCNFVFTGYRSDFSLRAFQLFPFDGVYLNSGSNSQYGFNYYYSSSSRYIGFSRNDLEGAHYYEGIVGGTLYQVFEYTLGSPVYFSSGDFYIYPIISRSIVASNNNNTYSFFWFSYNSGSVFTTNMNSLSVGTLQYHNAYPHFGYYFDNYTSYLEPYLSTFEYSPMVDNRFHARVYKNLYEQNILEIKWDSNVYPSTGSFTYLNSVLQLTLMVDGNSSFVIFDSELYPDLFVTPNTSYIPYMFTDSVGNVINLNDVDSAYLIRIQLTQYAYPSSASSSSATAYSASTVINLSLLDSVQLPIWSDPTISQQGGHIIDIATGNVYDNVSFSPPDGYSQQHLSDLESVPWADVKVISQVAVTGNSQSAIDNLYKDVAFLLMQDWKHFADSSLTDFNDVAAYIQSENQFTDTYDIILFLWNENGSELCWVTYTHRYYIRLMYKQFGNFQTIMEGSAAYVVDIYDYLFSRLEPLNDNLVLYFDSALSNNQTILSYVQSINGFCNSIDNTLFSGFNSVIGSGGRSLTDIYNRLGDISVGGGNSGFILNDFMTAFENKMSYLFVPTYDGLDDNFDTAIDDLGILALPFSFSYELISACKVPYSYTLDITFPSMSIPWHEEMEGGSVDSNLVLWEDYDLSFNPASVIPSDWLEFFQYLNALLVLVSVTLLTYRHIFRHSEGQGGGTL